jgi:hypothetical protein
MSTVSSGVDILRGCNNRKRIPSKSPHRYGPKHGWIQQTYITNIHNTYQEPTDIIVSLQYNQQDEPVISNYVFL